MWSKHLGVWDPQWFVWYQRRGWNRMVQTWCHRCLSIHHISMWLSGGPPRFPKPRPWQGCWGLMGVGGGLWRITMYNYVKYRRRFGRWFCFVLFSNISRFTCVSDDRDMKWVQTYMKLTNVLPWKEWISVIGDIHSAVPNQTHGPWCTDQTTYPLYVNLKVGKIRLRNTSSSGGKFLPQMKQHKRGWMVGEISFDQFQTKRCFEEGCLVLADGRARSLFLPEKLKLPWAVRCDGWTECRGDGQN